MLKQNIACALCLAVSIQAQAIVVRHDVKPEKYLVTKVHPALVDMRHEGHGMLIAPEWVVTAAHTIFYDYRGKTIMVGGKAREVEAVIFNEGYSKPPEGIFQGDAGPSQAYLRMNHDIALVKLKIPIEDITPIRRYVGADEAGKIVTLMGRGNTGDGTTGQLVNSKGTLRKARNKLIDAKGQWLHYEFNHGDEAVPLEGYQGNGDSGGPAYVNKDGVEYLVGLASWNVYMGDLSEYVGGIYGSQAALIRLSYYEDWIREVMSWSADKIAERHRTDY